MKQRTESPILIFLFANDIMPQPFDAARNVKTKLCGGKPGRAFFFENEGSVKG